MIHSMAEFASLILPCLDEAGAKDIVEIGSEHGGLSQMLAQRAQKLRGSLICIDPQPAPEFIQWAGENEAVHHVALPSLEALKQVRPADAWFIDGDHNYYTVYHELREIDALQRAAERPFLVFLHDVSWPCARRDLYYAPERVPPGWRHPHSFEHGVRLDEDGASAGRGLRGQGAFALALEAGGPRNGVLTAVEDFLSVADNAERALFYAHVPAVFGLGVIFDAGAPWSTALAELLLPYHANPLIARLEENRLRNWLEVVDWQDRSSE